MTPCVLVIGHDPDRLQATRDALALGGLTNPVVACDDAAAARTLLIDGLTPAGRSRCALPAVVVTDLRLPQGSGLDVLRFVRGHLALRRTPVVVVAEDATDHEIAEVTQLGAAAFLSQHLAADVLAGVIRDSGAPWSVGRWELGA